jgi:sugar phosphate isomerase/epimerase
MEERNGSSDRISRRGFLGSAAVAAGAVAFAPAPAHAAFAPAAAPRPDSTINGVKLGINAPYSFRGENTSAEDTLKAMVELGLSWVELRGPAIEEYAGLPAAPPVARRPAAPAGGARPQPTPEQVAERQAAQKRRAEEIRSWRLSQSMDRFHDLRRMYEQAGVNIQLVKFPDLSAEMSDDEAAYIFEVAKALGAEGITLEPPLSETKRLGQHASKHRVMLGYHGHAEIHDVEKFGRAGAFEQAFFYSPFNGANVDIGHWTAGNNTSPAGFIREYSNRITNLHLKDRKKNQGPNVPWGEGDTPLREILQLMRDQKYEFQATIEMEHPIPAGSTVMAELAKCIAYAKQVLNS